MKKTKGVIESSNSDYKYVNLTILFLFVGLIFLPIIITVSKKVFSEAYDTLRCYYYSYFGEPCPFCGITTDIKNLLKGNIYAYKYNSISIPLILIALGEVITRIIIAKKIKVININKTIKVDIVAHIIIIIAMIIYCILFFKLNLARF